VEKLQLLALLMYGVAATQLVLSVFCVFHRSNRYRKPSYYVGAANLVASLFSFFGAISYWRAAHDLDYSLFYRATWITWLQMPFLFQTVLWIRGRHARWLSFLNGTLFVFWSGVFALAVNSEWVESVPAALAPYTESTAPYEITLRLVAVLHFLALLWLSVNTYKKLRGIARLRVAYITLAIALNAISALACATIFQFFLEFPFDPVLTSLFGLFQSTFLTYAMFRERLADIRQIVARILNGTILVGLATTVGYALYSKFCQILDDKTAFYLSFIVVGSLTSFTSLSVVVGRLINRLILRNRKSLKQSSRELTELLIMHPNIEDTLRRYSRLLKENFGVPQVGFYLWEDGAYRLKYSENSEYRYHSTEVHLRTDGVLYKTLVVKGQPFVRDEHVEGEDHLVETSLDTLRDELDQLCLADLVIPISAKQSVIGLICLAEKSNGDGFLEDEIEVLAAAAKQLGIAIENARRHEGSVDGVTGLYHQKYFKSRLQTEIIRTQRHKSAIALFLIDLDFFNRIVENHGNATGDRALEGISQILRATFRIEDVLCRYAAETFGVILTDTNAESVAATAERFRKNVEAAKIIDQINITVSIGGAIFNSAHGSLSTSADDLLLAADRALYEAKGLGRNRVVLSKEQFLPNQGQTGSDAS
jgi:diguanylate cyclase (GGDEF)-like protein